MTRTGATLPILPKIPSVPRINQSEGVAPTIAMDAIINFDNGTGALTAAKFNAGTHGAAWAQAWIENHNGTPSSNTNTDIQDHDVTIPIDINVGGTLYNGTSGQGLIFDFSSAPTSYDAYQLSVAASHFTNMVEMHLIQSNVVLSTDNYFNDIFAFLAGNFTIPQMQARFGDDSRVICAHSEGSLGCEVPFTTGDWLLVTTFHNSTGGNGQVLVHKIDVTGGIGSFGTVLGHSVSNKNAGPDGELTFLTLQTYLRLALAPSTGNVKIKLIAFNQTDPSFPAYSIPSVPTPESPVAAQTGINEVTFSWNGQNCQIVNIQRNKNSGGFVDLSLLYNTTGTFSYVDTDVADTDTVQYRAQIAIGSQTSSYSDSSNTVTVNNTFIPAAGNVLWLKADTIAQADNTPVTTWNDSSGLGNNVTQATGSAQPTYRTNVVNGMPVVRGDGGDHLSKASVVTPNEQHTIMIVLKVSGTNSAAPFYNGNAGANGYGFFQDGSGTRGVLFGGAVAKSDGTPSATNFEIWTHQWNGSNSTFWVNGVEETLTDTATAPGAPPNGDTLVMGLAGSNQWNGDVAEILVWDNVISAPDRTTAHDYLGAKYAITVP
jgi:hypothetical protein